MTKTYTIFIRNQNVLEDKFKNFKIYKFFLEV